MELREQRQLDYERADSVGNVHSTVECGLELTRRCVF